jgi:hypothetical protein
LKSRFRGYLARNRHCDSTEAVASGAKHLEPWNSGFKPILLRNTGLFHVLLREAQKGESIAQGVTLVLLSESAVQMAADEDSPSKSVNATVLQMAVDTNTIAWSDFQYLFTHQSAPLADFQRAASSLTAAENRFSREIR